VKYVKPLFVIIWMAYSMTTPHSKLEYCEKDCIAVSHNHQM